MIAGPLTGGFAAAAGTEDPPTPDTREMWEIALEEGYTHYDTIDLCGGNSHLQGICVDDKMEYMYFSYTSALAKVDMKTGKVVGSVGGFGQGSFGTPGGAHLGCLAYYDGKIYGSLEYKEPGKKFFVAVFDEDAITDIGMDMKEMDTGVYGILLEEPTSDFRDPLNDTVSGSDGFAVNEEKAGHKFGCSGIDGVTFAPMPGDSSGKMYMFVAYGVYGNNDYWKGRYDNNYNVLQVYDTEKFDSTEDPVLRRFTYERGLSADYEPDEALAAEDTLYVWTGTTSYGAQNIERDRDTDDIVLYTYGPAMSWSKGHTMYVVDGSQAPVEKEIEVGQSNKNPDQAAHDAAVAKAEMYQVDDRYPVGKHAVLKCICGSDCQETECGDTGVSAMVCGGSQPASSTTGIASIGNGYYYIADGATTASLYQRDENYNFKRVTIERPAEAILHYSMDAADLEVRDGVTYMKDTLGSGHDAVVVGTAADKGAAGETDGSLSFNAWNYPAEPGRVYLEGEAIDYINAETRNTAYSYSFWSKIAVGADSDGNFDPFIGFYRADGTYAGVFEQRWRNLMKYVVNGVGSATVGAPGDSGSYLVSGSTPVPGDEGWHFYTVTENEGAGTLYLDGVRVGTYSVPSNHLTAKPFASFEVGGGRAKLWLDMNNRGRLIGSIDDITIYSGELTAEQVQAAYDAKKERLDSDPSALPSQADPSRTPGGTGFSPAYPVHDLTADAGQTLEVTAEKDVKSVFTLSAADVAVSGKIMTFSADWLEKQECGIVSLTVEYTDGSTGVLKMTVTDGDTPVLNYTLSKSDVSDNVIRDTSNYGVDAFTTASAFGMDHEANEDGALVFDGHNYTDPTYVKLSEEDTAWLNSVLQEGYTINFWANANIENGNKMSMLGLYADNARPLGVVETYDCDGGNNTLQADGKMTVQLDIANGSASEFARTAADAARTGDWYMYTATYDEATKTAKLYINGAEAASKVVTADVLGEIAQFYVGTQYKKYYSTAAAEDWTTRGGFRGLMDSLTVYNKALGENEIKTLYGGGSITPGMKAKPVMHWTLDANTLSGDGTLVESAKGYKSYYQNITPVAGVDGNEGGALYFDGTADSGEWSRVWLGDEGIAGLNGDIANQVTMSFWMKPDCSQTNESLPYTAAWSPVAGIYGTDTRFLMVAEYRGNTLNYCATIPGLSDQRIPNTTTPKDGQWYYVVMTWDGETTETVANASSVFRRIYITGEDGVTRVYLPDRAAATSNANTAKLFDSIGHVEIGGQNSKGYWSDTNVRGRFVGAIDDLKVYNIPLTQSDVEKLYTSKPITNNELYLPEYQFEIGVADADDLTFAVRNAGSLTAVSGLEDDAYHFENGIVTLDHDALVELGLGDNLLTLSFANGERMIRVTVFENRGYFSPEVISFDKAAPADISFDTRVSFTSTPVSIDAEGLQLADYEISGRTITVKSDYFAAKQPGAVDFRVTSENGETRVMTVYVQNTAPAEAEPYPLLYYKMDQNDLTAGPAPAYGAAAGTIRDHSGNGIDLQYGGLTRSDSNKDGTAGSSIFFDGYRDYDMSRAYLDEDGMDYLKDAVDNQISFSFWHASPRITCNYMPVLGVFGEDKRPAVVAQFNTTGGERPGAGASTNPAVITTPAGSIDPNAGVTKSDTAVAMDNTWHHYVVVYDGETGTATLYVDNVQKAQAAVGTDQLAGMAKFEIGGLVNASYYNIGSSNLAQHSRGRLYGDLDEIKVYNVALTAENVAALYKMGVDSDLPFDATGVGAGTTNSSGNVSVTGEGVSYLVGVTYQDGGSAKPIVGAAVSLDGAGAVQVQLPEGNNNQNVSVKVMNADGTPVSNKDIVLKDGDGFIREGRTDAAGIAAFGTANKLTGIAMESYPDTVQYKVGAQSLSLTGAVLKLTYQDGSDKRMAITKEMVSGFDSSRPGAIRITVTYEGFTTFFNVIITEMPESGEMWETALLNGYYHYDTIDLCGGSSHMQGICVDDKMEYMYFSYTDVLAKVDLKTGKVVGSVGGFGAGSFGTPGGAHLGCLAYYDGKIYGSLEYKEPGKKFFIAVFDEDAITEVGMDMKDMESGVDGILLYEPTSDFRDPLGDTVSAEDGFAVNEENAGHKYACSGIDGVTFGTMPGDTSGKMYLFVAYGVYGGAKWSNRYDNNYNVIQVYDPDDLNDNVVKRFTYERGLSTDYEDSEALHACDTLYVWTGNTNYGAQNMEWDRKTGDIVLYTYANTTKWHDYTMFVIDGSRAPVEQEIEVGQSNTIADAEKQAETVKRAEAYQVDGEYPTGKHAFLKCICGNGCQAQEWGDSGITAMICGGDDPQTSTYGIASLGNDYYYITDGKTTASLYYRNADYTFTRVTPSVTGIAMESYPNTVQYTVGASSLDLTGAAITVTYQDGTTKRVDITQDMISGFDSSTSGTNRITVTYEGCTTYFHVVIAKRSSSSSGSSSYRIDVSAGKGGTAQASTASAKAGSSVSVTVKAEQGYAIDSVVIANSEGRAIPYTVEGGVYTFVMPSDRVDVTVVFLADSDSVHQDCPSAGFRDVTTASWFHESVDYVMEAGLFNGASAVEFAPNKAMSRAMLVTVLYRLEGEPAVSGTAKFTDVADGSYYEKAVAWACANGIVNGCSNTEFRPDAGVTREQMAAILYRYADYKGYDVSANGSLDQFSDASKVSSYAADAMKWAVGEQLLSGVTAKTLIPQGYATRAQVATILMRFCESVVK